MVLPIANPMLLSGGGDVSLTYIATNGDDYSHGSSINHSTNPQAGDLLICNAVRLWAHTSQQSITYGQTKADAEVPTGYTLLTGYGPPYYMGTTSGKNDTFYHYIALTWSYKISDGTETSISGLTTGVANGTRMWIFRPDKAIRSVLISGTLNDYDDNARHKNGYSPYYKDYTMLNNSTGTIWVNVDHTFNAGPVDLINGVTPSSVAGFVAGAGTGDGYIEYGNLISYFDKGDGINYQWENTRHNTASGAAMLGTIISVWG